jgi:branched-chain amino acid transport system substrate-binding protein
VRNKTHRIAGLLVVLAAGISATAGYVASTATGAAAHSARAGAAKASSISARSIHVGLLATGGTAGAANPAAKPVTVGFVTDNGIDGLQGQPFLNAEQAAVRFINADLDGIHGRPLRVDTCQITQSAQQGTTCAEAILNNHAIKSFVTGADSFGDSEILGVINGKKPMFTAISGGPTDAAARNVFGFNGGIVAAESILNYVAEQRPSSVSIIGPNDPVTTEIVGAWKQVLQAIGVAKVTTSQFALGTTDLTSTITAAGAAQSSLVLLAVSDTQPCIAVANGLRQLGIDKPTVALGNCADPAVKKALGDLPHWTYYFPYKNTLAPDSTGQVLAYQQAVREYANAALANTNFGPTVFATFMDLAAILNKVGPNASSAQIAAATKAYTGPGFLGPKLKFGVKPFPGLGTASGRFYTYKGGGSWSNAAGGMWVTPPSGP